MARSSRPTLTRCVLWRPPHIPAPPDLLASLRRRAVAITECADPFSATAHVCRIDREGRDPVVLLLVSPAELPEAAEVLDVAARYAPHAARWWYDEDENPRLRQVLPEDVLAWTPRPPRTTQTFPSATPPSIAAAFKGFEPADRRRPARGTGQDGGPALRLTHDAGAGPDEPRAAAGRNGASRAVSEAPGEGPAPSPSTLLTNEELAMLLADDTPVQQPQSPMRRTGGGAGGGGGVVD